MKTTFFRTVLASLIAVAGVSAYAEDAKATPQPYTLANCPVSGKALPAGDAAVVKTYEGREVRFCCGECPAKYEADPAKYTKAIDAEIAKAETPNYPVETCVVSGEKLGGMGDPVDHVYQNRLVRLCCAGCIKKFDANPASFTAKLDEAIIAKEKDAYPVDTCVVSGEKLTNPVNVVMGNHLYKLCCKDCAAGLAKDPLKYQAMIVKPASAETKAEKKADKKS